MTETHATVRAVFRMWTGATHAQMARVGITADCNACDFREYQVGGAGSARVHADGTLTRLPSCPVCGVLLTMAEENRRTE